MAFWLCILNRENFETIKKEHVWGVAERHKKQLSKAMPGELCAFYLIAEGAGDSRKEPVIGGIAEIASEPYEDLSDIFPSKRNGRDSAIGCYLYILFIYATRGVAKWEKEVQSLDS